MRELTTCEMNGTKIYGSDGKYIGEIVGSYKGGFKVHPAWQKAVCMLPFENVHKYLTD